MSHIRSAAVAGTFYPCEPGALRAAVSGYLHHEPVREDAPARVPKLLVVPHAGYVYSGAVAGSAYALLEPLRGRIRRVVLLGPTHRVAVRGLAAPACDAFETPLGRVPVDHAAIAALADLPQVLVSDAPHALEHSLEVQLPFLQAVLGEGFSLVPLAVGDALPHEVDAVVERLWGGDETLIVISSDLSHYLSCAQARVRDRSTVRRILGFASDLRGEEACGAIPLNGALLTAQRHGLVPRLLDLRNSAETAGGDEDRVVGYGAIAFELAPRAAHDLDASGPATVDAQADPALGRALLAAARAEIATTLGLQAPTPTDHPRLHDVGASFVTLHEASGALRGCVGRLQACRPLGEDVCANALGAAFGDGRFAPVSAADWPGLRIDVSVLGALEPLPAAADFDAAAALLRPGVDGVVLSWRGASGTLLPQVWEQLPERREFLSALLRKAGLPLDFWAPDIHLMHYRVTLFEEQRHERSH